MEQLWYVVGFAFAGVSFVFLTIGAAWLVSHRNKGDVHKGLPYESGIDTYGDTHGRFGLSFYIYALLFVAFDIEARRFNGVRDAGGLVLSAANAAELNETLDMLLKGNILVEK